MILIISFYSSVCFLREAAGWSGVDPGGLLQRPRAAATGLGDLCLPGRLPPLLRLPRTPSHRPGGPHRHRLELLGKVQALLEARFYRPA